MYKNILVPMALSRTQGNRSAVKVAERLLAEGGKITAIHVLDRLPAMVATAMPKDHEQTRAAETLKLLGEQVEGPDGIEVDLVHAHPGRGIVDYAAEHDSDLIVVASSRPELSDLFLGSTAAWVVRDAACAVHVTR